MALRVSDGENEHALGVEFERDEVRELLQKRLPNWSRSGFRSRPDWMDCRSGLETLEAVADSFDEPVAQSRRPLFIPKGSSADFCARFRMKFDAHDGPQVQSEFPHVRLSMAQTIRVLPGHRLIGEEVRQPRRPQLLHQSPRDSTVAPTRYERVPHAITEAPLRASRPSTSSSV